MSGPVSIQTENEIGVIVVDNPPVNALSAAVRQGLAECLSTLEADDAIKAIVLHCAGRTFFAGADITEFDKPFAKPGLPEVVDRIEACAKPVIAALHGTVLGGGCEVALGCHTRIAVPGTRLGLPEVKLGLLPATLGRHRPGF